MKQALIAAGLALGLTAPLAAQTPEAQPAAPAEAAPAPGPTPDAKTDPKTERQRNTAAKLAGMIRFVAASCPDAEPNYDRFKQVIAAMGVDIKDLDQGGPLLMRSMSYAEAYRKDTPGSCKRAFEHFGESGTTIPGLIAHKPADAPTEGKPAAEPAPGSKPTEPPAEPPPEKPQ